MKRRFSGMHMRGPIPHPHVHSFLHRTHRHTITDSWVTKHTVLVSLLITGLIASLVAVYLIMFNTYQLTGVWQLFGE